VTVADSVAADTPWRVETARATADALPIFNDSDMAAPPLSGVVAEAKPALTLRWALAKRVTSISWLPVTADSLAVTLKALGLEFEAESALKLLRSFNAVNAFFNSVIMNMTAE